MSESVQAWHRGNPGTSAGPAPVCINVRRVEQVTVRALQRYNRHLRKQIGRSAKPVTPRRCDLRFLLRITENYIRHCLSDYDAVVDLLSLSCGFRMAGIIGHRLAVEAIDAVYPELAAIRRRLCAA